MDDSSVARLRRAGLRVTPQRRAILEALAASGDAHPSAEEVFRQVRHELPELSRGTVYNTLNDLVRVGLLQTVEEAGRIRFDPNLDTGHHHFRCRVCGRLYDVTLEEDERASRGLPEGFQVERVRIVLEGTCPSCS